MTISSESQSFTLNKNHGGMHAPVADSFEETAMLAFTSTYLPWRVHTHYLGRYNQLLLHTMRSFQGIR